MEPTNAMITHLYAEAVLADMVRNDTPIGERARGVLCVSDPIGMAISRVEERGRMAHGGSIRSDLYEQVYGIVARWCAEGLAR